MDDLNESILAIRKIIFDCPIEDYPWYKRDSKSNRKVKRQEQMYRNFIESYLNVISGMLKRKIYDDFFHTHSKCIESSQEWYDLQKRLNTSTNQGTLVSFKTSLERNAYTLNFLTKRASYILGLFGYAEKGISLVRESFLAKNNISVCSFGGGPGFSLIGFYGYLLFDRQFHEKNILWYIFDYEEAWCEQVEIVISIINELRTSLQQHDSKSLPCITVKFSVCDVQSSIIEVDRERNRWKNARVKEIMRDCSFDLLLYSYVLVENSISLRDSNYIFVKEALKIASIAKQTGDNPEETIFCFVLDSTHRIFPGLINTIMSINENSHFVPKFKRKRGLPRNALLILFPQIRVNLTGCNKNNLAAYLYCQHGFMSAVDLGKDEDIEKFVIDCESQEKWRKQRADK